MSIIYDLCRGVCLGFPPVVPLTPNLKSPPPITKSLSSRCRDCLRNSLQPTTVGLPHNPSAGLLQAQGIWPSFANGQWYTQMHALHSNTRRGYGRVKCLEEIISRECLLKCLLQFTPTPCQHVSFEGGINRMPTSLFYG